MNDFLKSKKNIINTLVLLILILAIPLGLNLIRKQQTLKSRAVTGPTGVIFSGPNVATRNNKTILKLQVNDAGVSEAKVDLIITAPNAPGTQPTSTPGPSGSPAPTSVVSSSPTPSPSATAGSATPTPSPRPSPTPTP